MLAGIIDLTTFTVVHDIDRDFLDSVLLLELNESSILVVTEVDILTRLKEVVRYATGVDRLYFLFLSIGFLEFAYIHCFKYSVFHILIL